MRPARKLRPVPAEAEASPSADNARRLDLGSVLEAAGHEAWQPIDLDRWGLLRAQTLSLLRDHLRGGVALGDLAICLRGIQRDFPTGTGGPEAEAVAGLVAALAVVVGALALDATDGSGTDVAERVAGGEVVLTPRT